MPACHARVLRQIAAAAVEAPYRDPGPTTSPSRQSSMSWFDNLELPTTLPPQPTAAYSFLDATVAPAESGIDWASLLSLDGQAAPLLDPLPPW